MIPILSLLLVILISMLVVKVASVTLTLTGLSPEAASFQARSAFTGSGFTTQESEAVVSHPVRRRVVMVLMLLGNAGLVTAITSLLLSFSATPQVAKPGLFQQHWFQLLLLAFGIYLLWRISCSAWFDRRLTGLIEWALRKWTDLNVRDYVALFRLQGEYAISEIAVKEGDWLAGNTLVDLRLNHEGLLVLGIERTSGEYLGAPRGQTQLLPGDILVVYGRESVLADIDRRKPDLAGFTAFVRSCKQQAVLEQEQEQGSPATTAAPAPADAAGHSASADPPSPNDSP